MVNEGEKQIIEGVLMFFLSKLHLIILGQKLYL